MIVERCFRQEGVVVSANVFEVEKGVTTYYVAFKTANINLSSLNDAMKRLKFYGFSPDALFCDEHTRNTLDKEFRVKSALSIFIKRRGE